MKLTDPIDRVFTLIAQYESNLEKVYVTEPHRVRGLLWRATAAFLLALVAILVDGFVADGSLVSISIALYIGWNLGRGAMRQVTRARAYRNGWIDGRIAMISAMGEAQRRGLAFEEWLDSEFERDREVMKWL